jgi:hypothetical protein
MVTGTVRIVNEPVFVLISTTSTCASYGPEPT